MRAFILTGVLATSSSSVRSMKPLFVGVVVVLVVVVLVVVIVLMAVVEAEGTLGLIGIPRVGITCCLFTIPLFTAKLSRTV